MSRQELADGSLRARLHECQEAGQGLPVHELLWHLYEAAEALDYLHEQKVHHRDIKPDNLLLVGKHLKVADFGLARLLESLSVQTASHAGTPRYMAPELWTGRLSAQSDQYSLAVTYGELRLGRFPIPYDSPANLMYAHLRLPPELDPLPAAEQKVLLRALAKEPGARYPSCTAFARALAEAVRSARPSNRKGAAARPVPGASGSRTPVEVPTDPASSHPTEPPRKSPARPKEVAPTRPVPQREKVDGQGQTAGGPKRVRLILAVLGACVLMALVIGIVVSVGRRPADTNKVVAQAPPREEFKEVPLLKEPAAPEKREDEKLKKAPEPEPAEKKGEPEARPGLPKQGPPGDGQGAGPIGEFAKSLGMVLVPIAAGEFKMGSSDGDANEKPPHPVKIGRPFLMAAHKTTQAQFQKVLGRTPSYFSATGGGKAKVHDEDTSRFPVETVTFFDAVEFCIKLSEKEGLRACYRLSNIQRGSNNSITAADVEMVKNGTGYRLPTEAEWEYCGRAGTTTTYSFGNDATRLGDYAWFGGNSESRTHPVEEKKENPWKLYDMGGLVWEWCEDFWHESYNGAPADSRAWLNGGEASRRVVRGGS